MNMKAIVAEPPKRNSVKLVELHKPIPKQGEVLLRTQCVGIDGTDREIDEGIYGTPPEGFDCIVLGHEAIARVQDIGEQVLDFSEGDLVVPTVRRPCEENCLNCRVGETDMCLTGNYFEHGIYRLHGFASEYALSDADFLVKIPSRLEDVAVLLEPLSIAEKAVSQSFRIQERLRARYREKMACQEFGNVLTSMVLGNRLVFGSVSSNKDHFEMGIRDMNEIKRRYGDILDRLITKRLSPTDFGRAFRPEREDIKTAICFK